MEIRYITEDEILESHIAVERANGAHGNEVDLSLIAGALKGSGAWRLWRMATSLTA